MQNLIFIAFCKMKIILILFLIIYISFLTALKACPTNCKCLNIKIKLNRTITNGHRIVCKFDSSVKTLSQDLVSPIPLNATSLNLKSNSFITIEAKAFEFLSNLFRIDLSKNSIDHVDKTAFKTLAKLEKLDLSFNRIHAFDEGIFSSLKSLQKLILNDNLLSQIPKALLAPLISLKFLDLSKNDLICDCYLSWIVPWSLHKKITIPTATKCKYPLQLKSPSLSSLTASQLHCDWPLYLPIFEMIPTTGSLIVQGDSIGFMCQVSNVEPDLKIKWYINGIPIYKDSMGLTKQETFKPEKSNTIISTLRIDNLQPNFSGLWECRAVTARGNTSIHREVFVINTKKPRCHRTYTSDNKGEYIWPDTIAGMVVHTECQGIMVGSLGYQTAYAHYHCSENSTWENLDSKDCPYVSEVTKVLEQFAKTNLSLSRTNVLASAKGLRNYTSDGKILKDKMDIVYIAQTLENYVIFVDQHKEIGNVVVDVANTVMSVDKELLSQAQAEDRSCSKLVEVIQIVPDILKEGTINRFHHHIVVEEFFVKSDVFPGMTCTSYLLQGVRDKRLHCNYTYNYSSSPTSREVDASLHLPSNLFLNSDVSKTKSSYKIQFVYYQHSGLFPRPNGKIPIVTSPILSATVASKKDFNLTEPVIVKLRVPVYSPDVKGAWWDFNKNDWSTEGCEIITRKNTLVTFSCMSLSSYGILQLESNVILYNFEFKHHHPVVYLGSGGLILFLLITLFIYGWNFKKIRLSSKKKHCLMNIWVIIILLCLVFTLGMWHTSPVPLCQWVGLLIHYLTYCTLTWIIVYSRPFFKDILKKPHPEASDMPPKPLLEIYMFGWGPCLIYCGIIGAIYSNSYRNEAGYCFLGLDSWPMFGIPICLELLFLFTSFVRANWFSGNIEIKVFSEVDPECSISTHLKYIGVMALMFLLLWLSGAVVVCQMVDDNLASWTVWLTSCLYFILSWGLGLAIFYIYYYSRSDAALFTTCKVQDSTVNLPMQEEAHQEERAPSLPVVHVASTRSLFPSQPSLVELSSIPEVNHFYDPRQIHVAKKFFEKHRHYRPKQQPQPNSLFTNNNHINASQNSSENYAPRKSNTLPRKHTPNRERLHRRNNSLTKFHESGKYCTTDHRSTYSLTYSRDNFSECHGSVSTNSVNTPKRYPGRRNSKRASTYSESSYSRSHSHKRHSRSRTPHDMSLSECE